MSKRLRKILVEIEKEQYRWLREKRASGDIKSVNGYLRMLIAKEMYDEKKKVGFL